MKDITMNCTCRLTDHKCYHCDNLTHSADYDRHCQYVNLHYVRHNLRYAYSLHSVACIPSKTAATSLENIDLRSTSHHARFP